MIVPVNQRLTSDFDPEVRAFIERYFAKEAPVFSYNAQRWVKADHVHVIVDSESGKADVKSCGTTLDSCEPYIANAVYEYGLC